MLVEACRESIVDTERPPAAVAPLVALVTMT